MGAAIAFVIMAKGEHPLLGFRFFFCLPTGFVFVGGEREYCIFHQSVNQLSPPILWNAKNVVFLNGGHDKSIFLFKPAINLICLLANGNFCNFALWRKRKETPERTATMGGKSVKMLSFLDNENDRKQVNAAFKKYDADGSGMLNRDEFKKVSYLFEISITLCFKISFVNRLELVLW